MLDSVVDYDSHGRNLGGGDPWPFQILGSCRLEKRDLKYDDGFPRYIHMQTKGGVRDLRWKRKWEINTSLSLPP